ncbi:triadin [Python bivittatus]|uniref:Triadin n=1 Tax=Python bivittatus TaxID=176946 RepID=A0A9F5IW50_PYTBI|nr:triadin [Python bivittatus]
MTEITAEGPVSTTTVIDNKNGTVSVPHMKMSKRSVSEDFATTFSSPAAWLLVVALIITWSAVAIVMFDLVDYKTLAGQSINKLTTDPLRILHGAVEDSTNSIYGFLSLLSDLIFEDEDENGKGEGQPTLKVKEEIQPPVKKKEIQIDKPEKIEKVETKPPLKEIQIDRSERQEKIEKKLPLKVIHKEKPEKPEKPKKLEKTKKLEKVEKPQKKELVKVLPKEKPERHVSSKEKPAKQEKKKAPPSPKDKKSSQVEEKIKKDVKGKKTETKAPERLKPKEIKAEEVTLPKAKEKKETALVVREKLDQKDQFAFCRYMIDMFAHGNMYTGI